MPGIVGQMKSFLPDTNYAGRKAGWYHEGSGAGDSVLRKGEGGLKMIGIGTEGERRMGEKKRMNKSRELLRCVCLCECMFYFLHMAAGLDTLVQN